MDGRRSTLVPLRDAFRRAGFRLGPRGRRRAGIAVALLLALCCSTPVALAAAPRGLPTPIYAIQGATNQSPLHGQTVDALGIVTGVTDTGFYLQDPLGDGSPATSDGLFVYTYRRPAVTTGACVTVRGAQVQEYYGKTELNRASSYGPADGCGANVIAPVALPTVLPGQSPVAVLEPFEGMWVQLAALDAVVYGPTKLFDSGEREIAVLPTALRPYLASANIDHTDPAAQASLLFLSNLLGAPLPATDRGDALTSGPLVGVLDYNFGKYQLLPVNSPQLTVTHVATGAPAVLPEQPGDYSICSFNVYGLGRGQEQYPQPDDYAAALANRAAAIAGPLQGCTIVALQETGAPADAQALAETLAARYGLPYTAAALPGPASDDADFPLTNSLLVRQDRGRVVATDQVQGCATRDYGLSAPGACPAGQYPVFDRPPLVTEVSVDIAAPGRLPEQRIWLIDNHWKSKAGDETVNARLRGEQAAAVARAVQALINADPTVQVIVLGDLNDFYAGPAVAQLSGSVVPPLMHTFDRVAPLDRYTYIFNGATQVLDHVLTTSNLDPQLAAVQIVHVNADFSAADPAARDGYGSSDHDPVRLVVRGSPLGAGAASVGGNLVFAEVTVTARDASGAVVATAVTDADGEFRLWGLAPGPVTLDYAPPPDVTLDAAQQAVDLTAGYTVVTPPSAHHRTAQLATWIALTGPDLVNRLMAEPPVR